MCVVEDVKILAGKTGIIFHPVNVRWIAGSILRHTVRASNPDAGKFTYVSVNFANGSC